MRGKRLIMALATCPECSQQVAMVQEEGDDEWVSVLKCDHVLNFDGSKFKFKGGRHEKDN